MSHVQLQKLKSLVENGLSNSDIAVEASDVRDEVDQLYPVEAALIENAVASRKREFSTGRYLARKAAKALGLPVQELERGAHGEVLWPAPLVGSISHTREWCVVALANAGTVAGIGVDIETDRFRSVDVKSLILHKSELPAFNRVREADQICELLRIFSAKEAIYKAIFPSLERYVDFREVCIRSDKSGGRFTGHAPENSELDTLLASGSGCIGHTNGLFVSTYILRRSVAG
tara:strand:- start:38050 stop:38745 length:696 start_codon:yes stop_codon:yes gene_type:complete